MPHRVGVRLDAVLTRVEPLGDGLVERESELRVQRRVEALAPRTPDAEGVGVAPHGAEHLHRERQRGVREVLGERQRERA